MSSVLGAHLPILSRHPCGASLRFPWSPCRHLITRLVPRVSKQAGGWENGGGHVASAGVFFQASGEAAGRCDIAIRRAFFLLPRTAAMIPGAGVVPHHPPRRSPHPHIEKKTRVSKQAGGGGGLDAHTSVGKREQASKTTRRPTRPHHIPIITRPHGPQFNAPSHQIAPPDGKHKRDARTRRNKEQHETHNDAGSRTNETTRRERDARRDADDKTTGKIHDGTRREQQGQNQASRQETRI